MRSSFAIVCVVLLILATCSTRGRGDYADERRTLVRERCADALGANVSLSELEREADAVLRSLRTDDLKRDVILPARNFLDTDPTEWKERPLFRALRKLPKGAVLHLHVDAQLTGEWFVREGTYDPYCYVCGDIASSNATHPLSFRFFPDAHTVKKSSHKCSESWRQVIDLRPTDPEAAKRFDAKLQRGMSMRIDDDDRTSSDVYPTVDAAWETFQSIFGVVGGFFLYAPLHERYAAAALDILEAENVQYVELRANLAGTPDLPGCGLYDLNQTLLPADTMIRTWESAARARGMGIRFVQNTLRSLDTEAIAYALRETQRLRRQYGDVVAAFDLVGQEDPGHPLSYFADMFLSINDPLHEVPYAFHAGETKRKGSAADQNVVDAVLLNSSRIGHGFSLRDWDRLRREIARRRIGVEICPLSNQVLGLVSDLRNHPFVEYISDADAMSVVISSDDPGLWGAEGVTFDWYALFLASGASCTGIGFLKRLALNSLELSFMSSDVERSAAMETFSDRWDAYLRWLLSVSW